MNWIIILIVLAVVALSIFKLLPSQSQPGRASKPLQKQPADVSYRLRSPLFTPAESLFYKVLAEAVSDDQQVFGKVRVADILQPASDLSKSQWQTAFNRISAKHFDYVICDRNTLSVQAVVELHDKSHNTTGRSNREQFLRKACKSAELTLLEFKARPKYVTEELSAAIKQIENCLA